MIHVVAASHGTDHQDGRTSIDLIREELAAILEAENPGAYTVHEAYVDVQDPSVDAVATGFTADDTVVFVPLLLSTGFHTQVDLQNAADASPATVRIAKALGPSAALAKLQRRRLEEAGWDGYDAVVIAAAGSSRADGREAVMLQGEVFSTLISRFTPHGFVAQIDPQIKDVVEEHQPEYVSSYLLGRGFFQNVLTRLDGAGDTLTITEPLVIPCDRDAARVVAQVAANRLGEALQQV